MKAIPTLCFLQPGLLPIYVMSCPLLVLLLYITGQFSCFVARLLTIEYMDLAEQQQQGADGSGSTNEREMRIGRLQRQKVRVSRNRILDSAAKVMEMYSSQKAVLEVEYFGEVGTGIGPTLEFHTLLSHDLQKVSLGMVTRYICKSIEMRLKRGSHLYARERDIVQAPLGLFPRSWPSRADISEGCQFHEVIEYFRL